MSIRQLQVFFAKLHFNDQVHLDAMHVIHISRKLIRGRLSWSISPCHSMLPS